MTSVTKDHGELDQVDGEFWRLRFQRRLAHAPDKVWRALIEPEHLSAWFPTDIEGERKEGAPLHFPFRNGEGPTMEGTLLTFDPPKTLEFEWGDDLLRFSLRPDGDGTVLTLVDVLDEVGKGARDGAGWHACLAVLAAHLAGCDDRLEDSTVWKEVHDDYVAAFPAEAATLGPPS